MNIATPRFKTFEEYLAADPSELPEGRFEYWDGELVEAMPESLRNLEIADYLFIALINTGIPMRFLKVGRVEVEVPGTPSSRYPDLTILDEAHLSLLKDRATVTHEMPPPRVLIEVVSPGTEKSDNYQRDYEAKPKQYAGIGVPEYWIVDPDRAVVLVGTLTQGAYQFQQFRGDTPIVSPTFPGLSLTASQVLTAGR